MEQELYGEEAANVICQLTGWSDALEIRDDGVFVKDGYLANDPGEQAFTWTPACEMDWHGAPDPLTAPALPIPFTASELAAFILDAAGYGIQSRFGWIECGLDEGELERLSIRTTKVRKALKEAYRLAQRAQCVAGEDNHDEQQRAADLLSDYGDARSEAMAREKVMERLKVRAGKDGLPEYGDFDIPRDEYLQRLARTNESVATQKAVALKAKAEADKRHVEWRKAMVNELLKPTSEQAATRAPATGTATPAPAETKAQRQDRRLNACENAGLNFKDYKGRLPDGVGKVADTEGVKRQPFSVDVKAALKRRESANREGVIVRRA